MKHFALPLTIAIALYSCQSGQKKEPVWSELPEVTNLDRLRQTEFVPTLENPANPNKNTIYAPAFLYALEKAKQLLKSPIVMDISNSNELKLAVKSTSYKNTLSDTEYNVKAEVEDGEIMIRAFFNKKLPFETQLQKLDEPIQFNKSKVAAFGMDVYDKKTVMFSEVLYYVDDNNFILKLSPKDKKHEIILAKGLGKYENLAEGLKLMNILIDKGNKEKTNSKLLWKYKIGEKDIFAIPTFKFNIATNYHSLEGQSFFTKDNKKHHIEEAWQRTGFIFNENGAVVESETRFMSDSIEKPTITHLKKMIFDKPFLIIIKRTDRINPYFAMKVENAELMSKK